MVAVVDLVDLGDQVRDKVTGFKGIVTGKAQYLTGCKQVLVTPKVGEDGKYLDACWLDVDRVEIIGKGIVQIEVVDNGGPQQSPSRR